MQAYWTVVKLKLCSASEPESGSNYALFCTLASCSRVYIDTETYTRLHTRLHMGAPCNTLLTTGALARVPRGKWPALQPCSPHFPGHCVEHGACHCSSLGGARPPSVPTRKQWYLQHTWGAPGSLLNPITQSGTNWVFLPGTHTARSAVTAFVWASNIILQCRRGGQGRNCIISCPQTVSAFVNRTDVTVQGIRHSSSSPTVNCSHRLGFSSHFYCPSTRAWCWRGWRIPMSHICTLAVVAS